MNMPLAHQLTTFHVQLTGTLYASEIVNYLASTGAGAFLSSKDEIIQSPNIVLGHNPKAAIGISSVGFSKHFRLATAEKMDPVCHTALDNIFMRRCHDKLT